MNIRTFELIPKELFDLYEFHEWRNAIAVLSSSTTILSKLNVSLMEAQAAAVLSSLWR